MRNVHKLLLSFEIIMQLPCLYRRFPDNHFPGQTFPGQDISQTRPFLDNHFPGQTFPGQVILRNLLVHSVCKCQLYRPSHTICRYTEHLLMCACRPAVSMQGLFGNECSPTMDKS